jgi:hypothetical protein
VTPRSWEHSITHYEAKGHRVIAPGYPGSEMEVEELNADPGIIPGEGAFSVLRSRLQPVTHARIRVDRSPANAQPVAAFRAPEATTARLSGRANSVSRRQPSTPSTV